LFAGKIEKAIELAEDALRRLPGYPPSILTLAAARAHAGRLDASKQAIAQLLAVRPEARISTIVDRMMFPDHMRMFADGLRMAGLPE
jgi:hypothetical protein